MTKSIISKIKVIVLFLLIASLLAPKLAIAAMPEDEAARWADLPVIDPLEIDLTLFPEYADLIALHNMPSILASLEDLEGLEPHEMLEALTALSAEEQALAVESLYRYVNELTELEPEALEELMRNRMESWSQGSRQHGMAELTLLLNSGARFTQLTTTDRDLIFGQLDIAYIARDITAELLTLMERDGFTLADSVELIRIMSSGLFGYIEAQAILTNIPSSRERTAELTRFEQFAQRFNIVDEVNARRLVNRPFVSINGYEATRERHIGNISLFMATSGLGESLSFIDDAQMEIWAQNWGQPLEDEDEDELLLPEYDEPEEDVRAREEQEISA